MGVNAGPQAFRMEVMAQSPSCRQESVWGCSAGCRPHPAPKKGIVNVDVT